MPRDDLDHAFVAYLEQQFGEELAAFLEHPPVLPFIRVNTLRASVPQVLATLETYGYRPRVHPGLPLAIAVDPSQPDPTCCLHHFAGHFIKQSLASMLPVTLLDPQPGERVLDLCASPGSKTTQIAAAMAGQGEVWANDLAGTRMNALASRIDGCGVPQVILTNQPGERLPGFIRGGFDRILADVPCSGLGRNDLLGEIGHRFQRRRSAAAMPGLQYRLLLAACRLLKVGGQLVYSTCSLTVDENEAVVDQVLQRLPMRVVSVAPPPGLIVEPGRSAWNGVTYHPDMVHAWRLRPWENPTEGFFAVRLEKTDALGPRWPDETPEMEETPTLSWQDPAMEEVLAAIAEDYGVPPERFSGQRFVYKRKGISIVPGAWETLWSGLHRAGLPFARRRGAMWRLSHAMIQHLATLGELRHNVVTLTHAQMHLLAAEGRCAMPPGWEAPSPYPVVAYGDLGPLASTYWEEGALRWKRARSYLVLP